VAEARKSLDPLKFFRARVTGAGLLEDAALDGIDTEVAALIDNAVVQAKAEPSPAAADLPTDVYKTY
jgi:pyruvate dehydrogenase E1 component alpha subunit